MTPNIQKAADDARTIYRLRRVRREKQNFQAESKSVWTYEESLLDREFMFDDEIVNSMAYRRAIASLLVKKAPEKPELMSESLYDSIDKIGSSTNEGHSVALKSGQGAECDLEPKRIITDSTRLIPRDEQGFPLIIKAAMEGKEERVAKLLEDGAHCEAIVLETGRTSLMEAAYGGHTAIVKMLLSYKCRVNPVDRNSMNALLLAVVQGHANVVKALVMGGASTSERDSLGRTPLHLAAQYGNMDIVRTLTVPDNENDSLAFHTLTYSIDVVDLFHRTPLHHAARNSHVEVVSYLKELGARLDLKDRGVYYSGLPESIPTQSKSTEKLDISIGVTRKAQTDRVISIFHRKVVRLVGRIVR